MHSNSTSRLVFLFLFSVRIALGRYPIGNPIDQTLPTLGSRNGHLPPWVRGRGFWDPQAQILCSGPLLDERVPDMFLPPDHERNHRELGFKSVYRRNIRSLCAKVAYGGSLEAWTAGGYCASSVSPPTVVFEQLPPAGGESDTTVQRVFLLCQHSCRCVDGTFEQLREQGRPASAITTEEAATWADLYLRSETLEISKDIPPRARLYSTYPSLEPGRGTAIPVYFIPEIDARRLSLTSRITENARATTLWIPPFAGYWAPQCPRSFSDEDLQQACAAQWFGGSSGRNFGLVCRPSQFEPGTVALVTEDAVSHPIYRQRAINAEPQTVFVRTARSCIERCMCPEPDKAQEPSSSQVTLVKGIFDTAIDFITGTRRQGESKSVSSTSLSAFGVHGTFRTQAEYVAVEERLRRNAMCKSNKVNGFDLAGSIAAQSLCQRWARLGK